MISLQHTRTRTPSVRAQYTSVHTHVQMVFNHGRCNPSPKLQNRNAQSTASFRAAETLQYALGTGYNGVVTDYVAGLSQQGLEAIVPEVYRKKLEK